MASKKTYLINLLGFNLHQTFNDAAVSVLDGLGLEGIRAHFIPRKTTLVNDHDSGMYID
jgi:hypothetical protein